MTSAHPEATDEALVARSGRGDRSAFDRLVDRHGGALFRFAARTCRNERDAEDAVQDGLLAAWRGAATFRGEASARAWLFQVILHACRRRARRRAGEPASTEAVEEAEAVPGHDPSPEAQVEARQTGAALAAALAAMPEEGREVLLLRDVEGLSGEEAAAALGVGLAAMKSRLHRARLDLKERVVAILGHAPQEGSP